MCTAAPYCACCRGRQSALRSVSGAAVDCHHRVQLRRTVRFAQAPSRWRKPLWCRCGGVTGVTRLASPTQCPPRLLASAAASRCVHVSGCCTCPPARKPMKTIALVNLQCSVWSERHSSNGVFSSHSFAFSLTSSSQHWFWLVAIIAYQPVVVGPTVGLRVAA